jgi:hypothetical protein
MSAPENGDSTNNYGDSVAACEDFRIRMHYFMIRMTAEPIY